MLLKRLTGRNLLIVFIVFLTIDVMLYFMIKGSSTTKGDLEKTVPTFSNAQALLTIDHVDDTGNDMQKGSGFFIADNGRLLTAQHVVKKDGSLDQNIVINNTTTTTIEQVFFHDTQDLALLKVDKTNTGCIPLESSSEYLGEHATLMKTLTKKIEDGMSGSPLFSTHYSAIGVLVAKHTQDEFQGKYELITDETLEWILENTGYSDSVCLGTIFS